MERKLSDELTQELTFLSWDDLQKIANSLGVIESVKNKDWFETIDFLADNYTDEDVKELIKQYQRNVELSKRSESEIQKDIEDIHECYRLAQEEKDKKNFHKFNKPAQKRGRKRGSGVKEKVFKLFEEGITDYYKLIELGISLKQSTFRTYFCIWKNQNKLVNKKLDK